VDDAVAQGFARVRNIIVPAAWMMVALGSAVRGLGGDHTGVRLAIAALVAIAAVCMYLRGRLERHF
jgi:hypothetical protein